MHHLPEQHKYLYESSTFLGLSLPKADISDVKQIDRVSGISYIDFHKNYMICNKPCIILSITENWKSAHDWVTDKGKPNFKFLSDNFGSSTVPIADCNVREYNSQQKINMLLINYLKYWVGLSSPENKKSPNLYLKDWHFTRQYPCYKAYQVPDYFSADWLNQYCENETDDYKFVYMGPKGTWTPLHSDVFGSYSWSANICGRKRWLLFPPGEEEKLKDENNQLLYALDEADLSKRGVAFLEVFQEAGEAIFVPSGWHHQVWNLEDTISINHNWFNACNILHVCHCLKMAALDVEKEISDCKDSEDWLEQLQIILRVHHGFNYEEMVRLLQFIFNSRSTLLDSLGSDDRKNHWEEIFDIVSIQKVYEKLLLDCNTPPALVQEIKICENDIKMWLLSL